MPPDMLVHPDTGHAIEPVRLIDQQFGASGQDRVRGGVPGHAKVGRGTGDRHPVDNDRLDRQHHRVTRQLPLRRRRRRDAVTPDPSTRPAPVAGHHHLQHRRLPPKRHMRQPAQHRIVADPWPRATRTGGRRGRGPAAQQGVVGLDPLGGHGQPETVQTAERIEAGWGSVSHKGPWVRRCGLDTFILPTQGSPLRPRLSRASPSRAQRRPFNPLSSVKSRYGGLMKRSTSSARSLISWSPRLPSR